ncbi:hypothetical protein AALP_AA7G151200 [Arabis alpina]|uniref:Uncharacterized protein n=1 Tax=Arabis alpina TaxID=50452 RepID=A0A087GI62_ARAAL|nr:hypothetical protein AALP_AA7G151200 [Arabis alpina]
MAILNYSVVDSNDEVDVPEILAEYNFLSDAWYATDQKNQKLNIQNGELVDRSNQLLESRDRAEKELKKLLEHSQDMNFDLASEQDTLNLRVADLTSASAKAEEDKRVEVSRAENQVAQLRSSSEGAVARAVEEAKKKAKGKLRIILEVMEARSKAQTEVDRLSSPASQVFGALGRIEKDKEQGVPIDAEKKKRLEVRLAGYNADAAQIVLSSLPEDSSDDEENEEGREISQDISTAESSDDDLEKTEVDGRMTVARKTPALTCDEVDQARNDVDEDEAYETEPQDGQTEVDPLAPVEQVEDARVVDQTEVAEQTKVDAFDASTWEPIAPLFLYPEPSL